LSAAKESQPGGKKLQGRRDKIKQLVKMESPTWVQFQHLLDACRACEPVAGKEVVGRWQTGLLSAAVQLELNPPQWRCSAGKSIGLP
jgi:hypothetical protein